MTIKLTEEDAREICKALGFFEAVLLVGIVDSIKDVGFAYIDHIQSILDDAPADEKQ